MSSSPPTPNEGALSGPSPLVRPPPRPRHVLVLDISKSMLAPLEEPSPGTAVRRKIEVARAATYRIFEAVQAQRALFGLVTFSNSAKVAIPLTEIRPEIRPALDNMIALLQPAGRSAIWDALALGSDLLRVPGGGVVGNLVLVTDGWDNMSQRFVGGPSSSEASPDPGKAAPGPRQDVLGYLLNPRSRVALQIIGIGSGTEKDKGVDSQRMAQFAQAYAQRAQSLGLPCTVLYQEVITSEELFSRMITAFLDVPFEDQRNLEELHPDDVAQAAASAARGLRDARRSSPMAVGGPGVPPLVRPPHPGLPLEVDVLDAQASQGVLNLEERYGPLGQVARAFLEKDYARAETLLYQKGGLIAPVTRFYWQARVAFAQGKAEEAARHLAQAWGEAEILSGPERTQILRRVALLQAKLTQDRETEDLVAFFDAAETRARALGPENRKRLEELFDQILELRRTYAGVSGGGAAQHEALVETIFGELQDARLRNSPRDPTLEAFFDFVEIALAEMR